MELINLTLLAMSPADKTGLTVIIIITVTLLTCAFIAMWGLWPDEKHKKKEDELFNKYIEAEKKRKKTEDEKLIERSFWDEEADEILSKRKWKDLDIVITPECKAYDRFVRWDNVRTAIGMIALCIVVGFFFIGFLMLAGLAELLIYVYLFIKVVGSWSPTVVLGLILVVVAWIYLSIMG